LVWLCSRTSLEQLCFRVLILFGKIVVHVKIDF
jgi:hypothetical protein